ncbi:3-dehydroquinate dehydratase [Alteribacillus persepolensis]|uniref:3-dehydroquinate dehydratase n=1 Tax=Alteribacillus persepolensis TaxID=568899 RepID=A0A1G8B0D3_9BACI|nr:type I 3-dehydroquinate dehydratase [Alteribacillus persepolensis]SDH26584.1 3-dehydroquinate dehydratase [Alteribacillus persepolensis]
MGVKQVKVRDTILMGGKLSVCSALVAKSETELMYQAETVYEKKPDVIEWRVDFFEQIHHTDAVITTAAKLREKVGNIPLLLTIRSEKEGGEPIPLDERETVDLLKRVCETNSADLVDYELEQHPADIEALLHTAKAHGVKVILSYHSFDKTPSEADMLAKLEKAAAYQADIGKLAVMPVNMTDVLSVLKVTQQSYEQMDIPVITMSMGADGALTRLVGWKFGSALTFAVGSQSSAPGQIPMEVVKQVEEYLQNK